MIKNKYGEYTENQFKEFKDRIHSWIHWGLVYADENSEQVDDYLQKTLIKINALNELLEYNEKIIEIMVNLEAARIEYANKGKKTPLYRRLVLEAHEILDRV